MTRNAGAWRRGVASAQATCLWLFVGLCAWPSAAAAQPTPVEAAQEMVGLLEELATAVGEAPYACDEVATRVETFFEAQGPRMSVLSQALSGLTKAQETTLAAAHQPRLEAASARMLPGLRACVGNERLARAMQALSATAPAQEPMSATELEAFCPGWLAAVELHADNCDALGKALSAYFADKELEALAVTSLTKAGAPAEPCRKAWAGTLMCYDTRSVKDAMKALGGK